MKTVGKAAFFIEGDPHAHEYQSEIVEHEGLLWFVAAWTKALATDMRIPSRLAPLEQLPHIRQADGIYRIGKLVPTALTEDHVPQSLRHEWALVDVPAPAHIPAPGRIQ